MSANARGAGLPLSTAAAASAIPSVVDLGDYKVNLERLVQSLATYYLESGGNAAVLQELLKQEAACSNLEAQARMLSLVTQRIRSLKPDQRTREAVIECLTGTFTSMLLVYKLIAGAEAAVTAAAGAAAVRETAHLHKDVRAYFLPRGVNPRQSEAMAATEEAACTNQLSQLHKLFGQSGPRAILKQVAADNPDAALAPLDMCSFNKDRWLAFMAFMADAPSSSIADYFPGESGTEDLDLDLKVQACTAAGYSIISEVKQLNQAFGVFTKPANPSTMLAPAVFRRHQALCDAYCRLQSVQAIFTAMGKPLHDTTAGHLRMLHELVPHALDGYQGGASPAAAAAAENLGSAGQSKPFTAGAAGHIGASPLGPNNRALPVAAAGVAPASIGNWGHVPAILRERWGLQPAAPALPGANMAQAAAHFAGLQLGLGPAAPALPLFGGCLQGEGPQGEGLLPLEQLNLFGFPPGAPQPLE